MVLFMLSSRVRWAFSTLVLCIVILLVVLSFRSPRITEGMTATVHYRVTLESGEEVDSSFGREPLTFVVGFGQVILGFDRAVLGMREGERKNVTLPPEEAYGAWSRDRLQSFPREGLPQNISLRETLWLENEEGRFPVRVFGIAPDSITLDMNHPLAGYTLLFEIDVIDVSR